jgi:sigma-B regulation protein RsbU (phosphoserine phosphatase)
MAIPRTRSVAGKLIITIFASVSVLFAAVTFYAYSAGRRMIYRHAEENARNITQAKTYQLAVVFSMIEQSVENNADIVERNYSEARDLSDLLLSILDRNPAVFGSTLALEPDGGHAGFAPYYYRKEGRTEYKDLAATDYNYRNWEWYKKPRELGRPYWSEPYFDEGGGNALMTTYSSPLYYIKDGKPVFFGVLTADLSLDFLEELMASVRVFDTGFGFIVSRSGQIVAHPNRKYVLNKTVRDLAKEYGDPSLDAVVDDALAGRPVRKNFLELKSPGGRKSFLCFMPIQNNGWHFAVVYPEEKLLGGISTLTNVSLIIVMAGLGVLLGILILVSGRITRPLGILTRAAHAIAEGRLDTEIPPIGTKDEVGYLAGVFKSMQVSLREYIKNLTETTAAKERMQSELKIAHDIQMGLLPGTFPAFPDRTEFDLYAAMEPAREVGGDLYDFFMLDDGRLCFFAGDVSGKGVAAALYMSMIKTMVRSAACRCASPADTISRVNAELSRDNPSSMFVTLFLGLLEPSTGVVTYCNAGHNPPVVLQPGGNAAFLDGGHGPLCGLLAEASYSDGRIEMAPGGALLIYTDGVTECADRSGAMYGEERLISLLDSATGKGAEDLVRAVTAGTAKFMDGAPQADDITVMAVVYRGGAGASGGSIREILNADIGEVGRLISLSEGFCRSAGTSAQAAADVSMALEEMFVNICRHAHPESGPENAGHRVVLEMKKAPGKVRWSLEDDGIPFNPLTRAEPGLVISVEDVQVGGQGIHLARKLMDGMEYRREGGRNILEGWKKI